MSEKVIKVGGGITLTINRLNPNIVTVGVVKLDWDTERKEHFHWLFSVDLPEDKIKEITNALKEI